MWEKTVMSDEELEKDIRKDYENFSVKEQTGEIIDILIWTREYQAEITGDIAHKAGQESRCDWHKPIPQIIAESVKAGRREVVEFLATITPYLQMGYPEPKVASEHPYKPSYLKVDSEKYQAKLKEWGIDET